MPVVAPRSAWSRSASANTMFGDLPPSSSVTFFTDSAAVRMMWRPTSVEPVNVTLSTAGCFTIASPAIAPLPGRTFSTPGGSPASSASSPMRTALSGVSSAGFTTTVLPAARAPHAHGLAQRVREERRVHRRGLARELRGPAREVVEAARDHGHVDLPRLEDRLAVVERLQPRDLVRVRQDQVAEPPQQPLPLRRLHARPRAVVERRPRRAHRPVHVLDAGLGHGGDR